MPALNSGPLPPYSRDEPENRARKAERAAEILRAYRERYEGSGEDDETVLGDLLADLLHYADQHDEIDPDVVLGHADRMFTEERAEVPLRPEEG